MMQIYCTSLENVLSTRRWRSVFSKGLQVGRYAN